VVADRHKWLPGAAATPVFSQAKPATEVWSDHPPGVTIWNTYFECTPMTLFSGIVGEDGPQDPEELLRQLLEMPVAQVLRGGSAGAS
jgi:translation initiation factor 2B subunit (eIF-2B alpha/beta/delta family)